jgi:hypothetical protein
MVDPRHPLRQLRAGDKLDLVGKPIDHLAEGRDVLLAIAAGDQEIRRVPQRPPAALRRPARDRLFEVPKHRFRLIHG